MLTVNLVQGSDEWLEHRRNHYNASDAPAMMNASSYKGRSKLLKELATGEVEEVSPFLQKIFDDGHKFEAMARPWAEEIVGEDLFPTVGTLEIEGLNLSSSFDGLSMFDICFEHKTLNQKIIQSIAYGELDLMYRIQMEQQMLVAESEKCLFMASNGDKDTMVHCWYESNPELRQEIIDGWKQFDDDLKNYVYVPQTVAPVVPDLMELPALNVQIHGGITSSNLDVYRKSAHKFIEEINAELNNDQDFAVAENTVKFLKAAEDRIKLVKRQALSQTADIDELFSILDLMDSEFSAKRLELDKLVKAEKENKKVAICTAANDKLTIHIDDLNESLGDTYITHKVNFRVAIKGKRTFASIEDAANTALANAKIEVNKSFTLVEANLEHYTTAATDHIFLFMDIKTLIFKDNEAFVLIVDGRITTHKADEEKKLELQREQIKKDLEQKAIDDKNTQEKIESNKEDDRQDAHNNRMQRQENDAQEWTKLTNKVHTMAANAVVKSKKCQHTQELPLKTPGKANLQNPQKATTIEHMADKIAVKFCNDNELSPDRIGVLKAYIIHGYRKLQENIELENQSA